MNLPEKYQGEFDWVVAAQAITEGLPVQEYRTSCDDWCPLLGTKSVIQGHRYRAQPPREFSEGWYEYNSGGAWKANHMVYRTIGGCWWFAGIHADDSPEVDESRVGEKIK